MQKVRGRGRGRSSRGRTGGNSKKKEGKVQGKGKKLGRKKGAREGERIAEKELGENVQLHKVTCRGRGRSWGYCTTAQRNVQGKGKKFQRKNWGKLYNCTT